MTVIRVKHENNYVVLHKEILNNSEISLKAKGFWAFCMSKPDNWEFHVNQLEKTLKEGKEAIYSTIKELIKFGYITRHAIKDKNGRFVAVTYEIYETSQLKKILPHRENPDADNPPLLSNDLTNPPRPPAMGGSFPQRGTAAKQRPREKEKKKKVPQKKVAIDKKPPTKEECFKLYEDNYRFAYEMELFEPEHFDPKHYLKMEALIFYEDYKQEKIINRKSDRRTGKG